MPRPEGALFGIGQEGLLLSLPVQGWRARQIRLGDVGPLTLAKARDAALKKRVERDQGKDPQLEKRKERVEAGGA